MADFSFMSEQMEKLYRLFHTRIIKKPDAKRFSCLGHQVVGYFKEE